MADVILKAEPLKIGFFSERHWGLWVNPAVEKARSRR